VHITRGHIASQDGTRHAPYYCWRLGSSDRLTRHYPCGPPKTLWFFAPARFALLRCKTPKTLAWAAAIRFRSDVAAPSRGFSRPHRRDYTECGFLLGSPPCGAAASFHLIEPMPSSVPARRPRQTVASQKPAFMAFALAVQTWKGEISAC
jgi:hypothetical protein